MKKVITIILMAVILLVSVFALTGCTLVVETTDNSVSASVDGETTEKVDGILDWIVTRLDRIFTTEDTGSGESV